MCERGEFPHESLVISEGVVLRYKKTPLEATTVISLDFTSMHLAPLIQDLAVILALAAVIAFIFHRFQQPVVVGYILAGTFVGPHSPLPSPIIDVPNIQIWGELGVVFLMFHLGLEFSFRRLRRLSLPAGAVGITETGLMFIFGSSLAVLCGYTRKDAAFLGAMVAISSTTIIVKAFDELGLKSRRFAESVLGILIIEDLIAILLIVILNSIAVGGNVEGARLLKVLAELLVVVGGWFMVGAFLVPRFVSRVGQSDNDEILMLLASGLCLILAVTAAHFEYSMALGSFIMGSIISETREVDRIRRLVHPLRDLFAAVFFVSVGMLVDLKQILVHPGMTLLISCLVIGGKFIALLTTSLLSGQPFRHSVRVAMSMGQVGEFSFIIAGVGLATGAMSPELQPIIVSVALLTSFLTPYFIRASDRVSHLAYDKLPLVPRERLEHYSSWMALRAGQAIVPHWLKPGLSRLFANALLVAIVFSGANRFIQPWLTEQIPDRFLAQTAGFIAAFVLAAPFVFAMLSAARRTVGEPGEYEPVREANLRAFCFVLFTILWVGALSSQYVSAYASVAITLTLAGVLYLIFHRRLAFSYAWLEGRFLAGLEKDDAGEETTTQKAMRQLAPWDAHLVKLVVHPNSTVVGQSLVKAALRKVHGVNVIAIRRGERVIAMPESTEPLFPFDELLVLGTDEQIEAARPTLEGKGPEVGILTDLADYDIRVHRVVDSSPLVGQTLRASRVREDHGGLVVGVEREGRRNMNPPPDFKITAGDTLWIVGERSRLRGLL